MDGRVDGRMDVHCFISVSSMSDSEAAAEFAWDHRNKETQLESSGDFQTQRVEWLCQLLIVRHTIMDKYKKRWWLIYKQRVSHFHVSVPQGNQMLNFIVMAALVTIQSPNYSNCWDVNYPCVGWCLVHWRKDTSASRQSSGVRKVHPSAPHRAKAEARSYLVVED